VWSTEASPDTDGVLLKRIAECPAGYALVRKQSNPQADSCVKCPGTADYGYSLDAARWTGRLSETTLASYCRPCPRPATAVKCEGGTSVRALKDWWLVEELAVSALAEDEASKVDQGAAVSGLGARMYKLYQCDMNNCLENNTCANARTGPACSRCPPNFALEVGACAECPEVNPEDTRTMRVLFSSVAALVACVVWFVLSWTPVFGTTAKDFIMSWFAWPLRMFKKASSLCSRAQQANKSRKSIQGFLSDPNNTKLFQQYLKIFIAYIQVLGSFVSFKVKWPSFLGSSVSWMKNVSGMIKVDLLEVPGLTCVWATYPYANKFYFGMGFPLVVCFFLAIPVGVAWLCQNIYGKSQKKTNASQDLEMHDEGQSNGRLHLKWMKIGASEPERGENFTNDGLAEALRSKQLSFTRTEMERFGLSAQPDDVYIEVGDEYFKPAVDVNWNDRYENTVDVFWNNFM
jgi:hypothetical protein